MEFEPLDQFVITPIYANPILWSQVSVWIAQIAVVSLISTGVPLWRLLPRVGLSKWWALLAAFPLFAIVLFWIVGLRDPVNRD